MRRASPALLPAGPTRRRLEPLSNRRCVHGANGVRQERAAVEQQVAADEAGASDGASQLNLVFGGPNRGTPGGGTLRHAKAFLIATLAVALTAGTCDRYYGLGRTVSLQSIPDHLCVERALRAANVGTVTHRCDTSSDTGELTDFFRIQGVASEEWVALSIPRTTQRLVRS
jgi:hypothetical protein